MTGWILCPQGNPSLDVAIEGAITEDDLDYVDRLKGKTRRVISGALVFPTEELARAAAQQLPRPRPWPYRVTLEVKP